jgi:hypothetical protein
VSLFHNSEEAEKLALGAHIFACVVSAIEFALSTSCAVFAHGAWLLVGWTMYQFLFLASLTFAVYTCFQFLWHLKGSWDHVDHMRELRRRRPPLWPMQ